METALMLSLSGVGSVFINQWPCSPLQTVQTAAAVLDSRFNTKPEPQFTTLTGSGPPDLAPPTDSGSWFVSGTIRMRRTSGQTIRSVREQLGSGGPPLGVAGTSSPLHC